MRWIRGLNAKLPSFLRLDFFVKREGLTSSVFIGEITEAGASCLGWADGWTATFDAVLHAGAGVPFPHQLPPLQMEAEYEERYLQGAGKRHNNAPNHHPQGPPHGHPNPHNMPHVPPQGHHPHHPPHSAPPQGPYDMGYQEDGRYYG